MSPKQCRISDHVRMLDREACSHAMFKDYDSVELLLGLLDDESLDVRREAHASLRELFGIDVHYEADGDEVARHAAIRRYRDFWRSKKNSKLIEWGKNPEKARQSLEKQVRFQ